TSRSKRDSGHSKNAQASDRRVICHPLYCRREADARLTAAAVLFAAVARIERSEIRVITVPYFAVRDPGYSHKHRRQDHAVSEGKKRQSGGTPARTIRARQPACGRIAASRGREHHPQHHPGRKGG